MQHISRIYPCEFAELTLSCDPNGPRGPGGGVHMGFPITIGPEEFEDLNWVLDLDWDDSWADIGGEWDYDYVPDDDDDYPPEYNEDWDWE